MTPPPPAPFTSDEYRAASLWDRVRAAALRAWGRVQRVLMVLGAMTIIAAVAGLAGFAFGRHSVAPRPGEEARLDSAAKAWKAVADSARKVAEWEAAQRAILEQKHAALPHVEIREPGVLVITTTDQQLQPRVVPVPVEVTQTLATERAITASLRVELAAVRVEAQAERARADSLQRAVVLARGQRRGFLDGRVALTVGYGVTKVDGALRPGWQVGISVPLVRWP